MSRTNSSDETVDDANSGAANLNSNVGPNVSKPPSFTGMTSAAFFVAQ
jgi:hypothetical protein